MIFASVGIGNPFNTARAASSMAARMRGDVRLDPLDRRADQEGVVHRRTHFDAAFGGEAGRQAHHLGAVSLHREFIIDRVGVLRIDRPTGRTCQPNTVLSGRPCMAQSTAPSAMRQNLR